MLLNARLELRIIERLNCVSARRARCLYRRPSYLFGFPRGQHLGGSRSGVFNVESNWAATYGAVLNQIRLVLGAIHVDVGEFTTIRAADLQLITVMHGECFGRIVDLSAGVPTPDSVPD